MANEVKQEIKEARPPKRRLADSLRSPTLLAVVGAIAFVIGVGSLLTARTRFTEAAHGATAVAAAGGERTWLEATSRWKLWDLGKVWVTRKEERLLGDRKIQATFGVLVSREFMEGIAGGGGRGGGDLEMILRRQVRDLIQSILHSREQEIRKDPKRARILLRDDVLHGLKMGANPNDPQQRKFNLPFTDENVSDVFVEELEVTRY